MSNNLQVFNFESNEVRTLLINNEPWFVGRDVASVLGYSNVSDALIKHVDEEDKEVLKSQNATFENIPNRGLTVVNESGLYSLIIGSKLDSAKKFKRWVTSEVLPTIRKHGAYMTEETIKKALLDPDTIISLATELKREQEEKKALLEENAELKPKALFTDAVTASKGSVSVGSLAKMITNNGITIGQNRLYEWLRDNGYLIKDGRNKNVAIQRFVESGLFELKENLTYDNDGVPVLRKPTTMVTGKGQKYFIDKFLKFNLKGEQ